jgi:hypothetical protein
VKLNIEKNILIAMLKIIVSLNLLSNCVYKIVTKETEFVLCGEVKKIDFERLIIVFLAMQLYIIKM